VDETKLLNFARPDGMSEIYGNRVHTLVGPIGSLIHIGGSLHVAIGVVDFHIQVVIPAAQIVVSGRDPEVEHAYSASAHAESRAL